MTLPKFTAVTRSQGANIALKDGRVQPKTFSFDFSEVDPLIAAFRREYEATGCGRAMATIPGCSQTWLRASWRKRDASCCSAGSTATPSTWPVWFISATRR